MAKKRYFILTPGSTSERQAELKKKASAYYDSKDYEETSGTSDLKKLLTNVMKEFANGDCNAELLLTGMTLIAMSESDSIYVSKDWDSEDVCKISHMLAFTHGLDIVYESV